MTGGQPPAGDSVEFVSTKKGIYLDAFPCFRAPCVGSVCIVVVAENYPFFLNKVVLLNAKRIL